MSNTLFRLLPCPLLLVDPSLTVRMASSACEHLFGVPHGTLDGAQFPDHALAPLGDTTPRQYVAKALAENQEIRFRALLSDPSGAGVPVEGRAIPADDDGTPCALVYFSIGAEERVDALLLSIRRIRHEINNPLTGALGNINLLLRRDDLDEKTRRRLTTAEQEMKKISEIVTRLAELTTLR
jgi:signal transduction histidine kinase